MEEKVESKDKIFKSARIFVKGNVIITEDCVIQISSISSIWIGDIPKKPLPKWLLAILAILSLGCFYAGGTFILFGLVLLAIGGFILYRYYTKSDLFGLVMELNSGKPYSFISTNKVFLQNVLNILSNILKDNKDSKLTYNINFADGTIINDINKSDIKIENKEPIYEDKHY